MPKEFIVAIELGSSKITGIAGKKNIYGSISILAVVQEDSTSCIRKGVVYNIDKTVMCLSNIIQKLETTLKSKISQVYVGVGGQSIRSMKNVIVIPQEATLEVQDRYFVSKVVDGVTRTTEIKVFPYNDGQTYAVTDGLKPGDVIVAEGGGMVREGTKVKTKK